MCGVMSVCIIYCLNGTYSVDVDVLDIGIETINHKYVLRNNIV